MARELLFIFLERYHHPNSILATDHSSTIHHLPPTHYSPAIHHAFSHIFTHLLLGIIVYWPRSSVYQPSPRGKRRSWSRSAAFPDTNEIIPCLFCTIPQHFWPTAFHPLLHSHYIPLTWDRLLWDNPYMISLILPLNTNTWIFILLEQFLYYISYIYHSIPALRYPHYWSNTHTYLPACPKIITLNRTKSLQAYLLLPRTAILQYPAPGTKRLVISFECSK